MRFSCSESWLQWPDGILIEPGTETLSLAADPRSDGLVKSRTGDTTAKETYDNWYKAVYVPAEAEG